MTDSKGGLRGQLVVWLVFVLAVTGAASPQQATNSSQSTRNNTQENASGNKKLDAVAAQPETLPDSPSSVRLQMVADNRQESNQQSQSEQNGTQQPVGTAAAQSLKTTGVAASQPAGAAIAPAQQRRARSILIKVGVIVGAGVAVGTVVALSSASPSRPR